jgi:rubrerythrin
MEFKVRLVDESEPKSVQELERELVENHEQEQAQAQAEASSPVQPDEVKDEELSKSELNESDVLSFISKRYNKQINSFDELMQERSSQEEIPEDVAAYMKYRKETGRGYDDYLKLGRDYESMDQDQLLKEYLLVTQEGLDEEDVELMMEDYRYDEDLDEESKIKKTKIAKKKAIAEAKKFFNTQKEMYKKPLESSMANISNEEREEIEEYKQYLQQAKTIQEQDERKRNWFAQKTNEVFSNEFKGFEFSVNDKKFTFAPGDAVELKKNQSTPSNFINRFLDENGLMKDAAGYHRSLAIAMNPEKFAKFFYEQGLSDATDDVMRKTKNINMSERRAPEVTNKGGVKVRAVNPDSGRSLKIRSNKQ